jgi:hypothetical protein
MTVSHAESAFVFKGGATTIWYGQKTLNFFGKARYFIIVSVAYLKIARFYTNSLRIKECYYGPFKGEFGHFLLHNLPFLMNLHHRGVRIHYCGLELHRPFLVDGSGNSIIYKWYPLRDFFAETPPHSNEVVPPADVQAEIKAFESKAGRSGKPFLNIGDKNMYWFVFRNWQLKSGRQYVYKIESVYKTTKERSCVIFPRKKGSAVTANNGGPWDYLQIARLVSPFFDKVYITGHPTMSAEIRGEGNIEACLSNDNRVVIEKCSNASLIITQHSGAVHIGIYTNAEVLLIFNGELPIKGLIDTIRFRKNLTAKSFNYAFNYEQIESFVKTIS